MKLTAACPLLLALICPLIASCESAASRGRPAPAQLVAPGAQCRTQLGDAARELSGKPLTLAEDAFTNSNAVVLTTVGQSASGRMPPPTAILRLQLTSQGCQLQLDRQLDGSDHVVALPGCDCRALTGK